MDASTRADAIIQEWTDSGSDPAALRGILIAGLIRHAQDTVDAMQALAPTVSIGTINVIMPPTEEEKNQP